MKTTGVPTPGQIRILFNPFFPVLRIAADKGAAEVRRYFARSRKRKKPIDHNLAPELFRHAAKNFLDKSGHQAVDEGLDYSREPQARNGLLVECGTLQVRMLKLPGSGEPPAPRSGRRVDFYRQQRRLAFAEDPAVMAERWNLLLLWSVDGEYNLNDFFLVLPEGGDSREAAYHWMERLEVAPETAAQPPSDVADLELPRKDSSKTAGVERSS